MPTGGYASFADLLKCDGAPGRGGAGLPYVYPTYGILRSSEGFGPRLLSFRIPVDTRGARSRSSFVICECVSETGRSVRFPAVLGQMIARSNDE